MISFASFEESDIIVEIKIPFKKILGFKNDLATFTNGSGSPAVSSLKGLIEGIGKEHI